METWLYIFIERELQDYDVVIVRLGDLFFETGQELATLPKDRRIYYDMDFRRTMKAEAEYFECIVDAPDGRSTFSLLFRGTEEILGNLELIAIYYTNEKNEGVAVLCLPYY